MNLPRAVAALPPIDRVLYGATEGPTVRPELGACLDYRSPVPGHGYPIVRVAGQLVQGNKVVLEHTLGRSLAKGMFALHHCDRKHCVRASHLYEGGHSENARDRMDRGFNPWKGQSRAGEQSHTAKLNDIAVRVIRWCAGHGRTHRDLARVYHVHEGNVHAIVRRKSWRNLA